MSGQRKTVLVTGIHGFTGRYMQAELVAAGYTVVGLGATPGFESNYRQVDLMNADVLKRELQKLQPDFVVHLAALAFVGHGDANAFYQVNLLGARNLLEAIAAMGKRPEGVLLASSANVYGNVSEGILAENAMPAPANDYAVSKLAMEYLARLYFDKMPIVITRPFNYTGIGQSQNFLIPKIVSHFRSKATVIELGNLDVSRDFGDVRAVVQAYRKLIETPAAAGSIINVSAGVAYSLREVVSLCEDITRHKITIKVNPTFVRENEIKFLCGDPSRLSNLLDGWEPIPLSNTLRWMLEDR